MPDHSPDIGSIAGDIWHFLSRNGETSALRLRSSLKIPQSHFFLSLGWLAREGKVRIQPSEKSFSVSLAQE